MQTSGVLVNKPVSTGTDLRVIKWSHRCFPVTPVNVEPHTHHKEQVQPSAPSSYQPWLCPALSRLPNLHNVHFCSFTYHRHKQRDLKTHRVHQKAWGELAKLFWSSLGGLLFFFQVRRQSTEKYFWHWQKKKKISINLSSSLQVKTWILF